MIPNLRATAILLAGLTWSMATSARTPETIFEPYAELLQRHVVEHEFIAKHVGDETRLKLEAAEQTRYIDYDWQLNSPANIGRWLETNR